MMTRMIGPVLTTMVLGAAAQVTAPIASAGLRATEAAFGPVISNEASGFVPYGRFVSVQPLTDTPVAGTKAHRFVTEKLEAEHRAGGKVLNTILVNKGNLVVFEFWARLAVGPNGAAEATMNSRIQETVTPFTGVGYGERVKLTKQWKLYRLKGRATRPYAPGEISGSVFLAADRQTVDLGYAVLRDAGAINESAVPKN